MEFNYLLKGVLIGVSVSAPLGPIGVLCIQKTITKGRAAGFISGTGAVFGDTLYAIIAGFGVSFISDFLLANQLLLQVFGGLLLFFFGWKVFHSQPTPANCKKPSDNYLKNFLSVFMLTISNPITVLFFGAVFTGLGIAGSGNEWTTALVIFGVFMGTVLWWYVLSSIVSRFRNKFGRKTVKKINRTSGVLILVLGAILLFNQFI